MHLVLRDQFGEQLVQTGGALLIRPKGFSSTRFVPSGSDTCCNALQEATVTEGGSANTGRARVGMSR